MYTHGKYQEHEREEELAQVVRDFYLLCLQMVYYVDHRSLFAVGPYSK